MSCHGLKGGLGSASRLFSIGQQTFTLGALTLCNMGLLSDLLVSGRAVGGEEISHLQTQMDATKTELGSIIILLATDAPLSSRQLKRICARASAGLARTGTQFGSGSGDIVLGGFSTAGRVPHACSEDPPISTRACLHENSLDIAFRATIEAVEEAILNALFAAKTTTGKHGRVRTSLSDWWPQLGG